MRSTDLKSEPKDDDEEMVMMRCLAETGKYHGAALVDGTHSVDDRRGVKRRALIGVSIALLVLVAMIGAASAQNVVDQTWYLSADKTGFGQQTVTYWMYLVPVSCQNTVNLPTYEATGQLIFVADEYYGEGTWLEDNWTINIVQQTGGKGTVTVCVGVYNNTTDIFNSFGCNSFISSGNQPGIYEVTVPTSNFTTYGVNEYLAIRMYAEVDTGGAIGIKPCEMSVKNEYTCIGDFVWNDCFEGPYDGIQSDYERANCGVPNVNVTLWWYPNNASAECSIDGPYTIWGYDDTDSEGYYLFDGLLPGCYYLEFVRPDTFEGWTFKNAEGSTPTHIPHFALINEISF